MKVQQEENFQALAERVDRVLDSIKGLPEDARMKAMELKKAIEAFHEHALRKLVRTFRETEEGKELLLKAVEDPSIYAMFLLHGIIKQDLLTRVAAALEEVRPYMRSHGGGVELVEVEGKTAYVRLQGACSGCSLSAVTLKNGVEEAIKARVPEIEHVVMVEEEVASGYLPFHAMNDTGNSEQNGWVQGPSVSELEEVRPVRFSHEDHDILLVRMDGKVMAFRNQCPHMGMPLDGGMTDGAVITCPWHGFRFDLSTGECMTAPHVQLEPFPVRVEDQKIWIRLG
ncbi:NifU family protein [Parageobacillus thermoglucosidasius]|uniref:NifU family protein n=1 Tax=Parageobacillus thermoglucosidasius TaxID=1426 RepID=UPI002E1A3C11|nr:NifU family protein [Parageobacillus thermoglucosidasius]MED4904671.1 NifU family protein [Parageobacillus thermoglucosidasius]MED4913767.1 NifU family protein [Parageobacillus thermoglucosidasius]MED4944837.1 NifU family protein [Parageobacillus thermoglucosidasius]MED4982762.1 NifU family protein [Parageobacillus thermoglucosidasius]